MGVEEKVLEAVAKVAKRKQGEVRLESSFDDLGMDSLDRVCLLFELEQMFDVNIPDDEVRNVRNVRQMCEGVDKLLAAKSAGD